MKKEDTQKIHALFKQWAGKEAESIEALPLSGSDRKYYRLQVGMKSAMAVYNLNQKENIAFVEFAKHLKEQGIRVPEIYIEALGQHLYLIEDLGDQTLLNLLLEKREGETFPETLIPYYEESIKQLAKLQIEGGKELDYSLCYPKAAFDKRSIHWDLNYFKYYFLKPHLEFDEDALQTDFEVLANYLETAGPRMFMFRDFQARNIMIKNEEVYFIDFQGGRLGPIQYDLASLLFQAKAQIPKVIRENLFELYMDAIDDYQTIDRVAFKKEYNGLVLLRLLQVLGAYGFRGLFERKAHFLTSIPPALKNLSYWLENMPLPIELPELEKQLKALILLDKYQEKTNEKALGLVVKVSSFSYKKGIPEDPSNNGGGFVFDCRSLHNPGRYAPYKRLTGRDQPVIDFLKGKSDIDSFLKKVYSLVDPAVENYLERKFTHLMVSFGCTGGQHRSVYSADCLTKHLQNKYGITVRLEHIEQERKNWKN